MKIVAIIQARMGSSRLPGKVLKEVIGKPLLEYQIERIKRTTLINDIVIATTTKEVDNPIVKLCKGLSVSYFRGTEDDVLARYYETATTFQADIIVRLTSDCPLIDPKVVDKVIKVYLDNKDKYDYVSNTIERTYPRGMDVEVFSMKALQLAHLNATESIYREHVTSYMYRHPEQFTIGCVTHEEDLHHHRWTVDTIEDFELISRLIKSLYPFNTHFELKDILDKLAVQPEWSELNKHIEQLKI